MLRDTRRPSKPEYGARYPDARPFPATRNPGAGEDLTDLAAAVQLRLRVAIGLQTLTVKLRLLPGRNTVQVRGSPPFPAGVAQQRQQQFRKLPGNPPPRVRVSVGPFSCSRSSNYQSGRLRTAGLQVRVLPGVPFSVGMWFNPNSRGSRFRIWQPWGCKSLHAHQFHGAWPQRE